MLSPKHHIQTSQLVAHWHLYLTMSTIIRLIALFILLAGAAHNFAHHSGQFEIHADTGMADLGATTVDQNIFSPVAAKPASTPHATSPHVEDCILARMVLVPLERGIDLSPPSNPILTRPAIPLAPLYSSLIAGFQSRAPPVFS